MEIGNFNSVEEYLKENGYLVLNDTKDYKVYESWYKGKLKGFHDYKIYNGTKHCDKNRAQMNAAKMGAEYWSNLIWNDECFVTISKKEVNTNSGVDLGELIGKLIRRFKRNNSNSAQDIVNAVFDKNNFYSKFNELNEKSFAIGYGATVIHDNVIEYVSYENIKILGVRNGIVESAAFTDYFTDIKLGKCAYLMIHQKVITKKGEEKYLVKNIVFKIKKNDDKYTYIELTEKEYKSLKINRMKLYNNKHFDITRPNIVNNKNDMNAIGISVYANSIDILKMIDLALDGIKTSLEVGRPRIAITSQAIHPMIDERSGETLMVPVFDSSETAYYKLPEAIEKTSGKIIEDMTTPYRATEFEISLNKALSIYSQSIGLGEKAFKWENGGIKTATEVISENSTMYQTMRKHQQITKEVMRTICIAILEDNNVSINNIEIKIELDDSIITDKEQERTRKHQLSREGYIPKWMYLADCEGYTIEEAKKIVEEAKKESESNLNTSDFFEGGVN